MPHRSTSSITVSIATSRRSTLSHWPSGNSTSLLSAVHLLLASVTLLGLLALHEPLRGQEEADDLFGSAEELEEEATDALADPPADAQAASPDGAGSAPAAVAPNATGPAATGQAPSGSADANDPLFAGWQPQTAAEHLQTALWYLNRGNNAAADASLAEVRRLVTTAEQRAALYEQIGPGNLVRLISASQLAPESRQLMREIVRTAGELARSPERLAQLAREIATAPNADVWRAKTRSILGGEELAAAALIHELAQATDGSARQYLRSALVALGRSASRPCVAALEAQQTPLVLDCLAVLGHLQDRTSGLMVLGMSWAGYSEPEIGQMAARVAQQRWETVPGHGETVNRLCDEVQLRIARRPETVLLTNEPPASQRPTVLWQWNASQRQLQARQVTQSVEQQVAALRFARLWQRLDPNSTTARTSVLALGLETEQAIAGAEQPLPRDAESAWAKGLSAGPTEMLHLLRWSTEQGLDGAAAAACQVLAELGDRSAWSDGSGRPTQLVEALNHPHLRVQFAAAAAIHQLRPDASYPGASYWDRTAEFLASAHGEQRVIVAHGNATRREEIANQLRSLGWKVDTAVSGPDLRVRATESADYQLIVADPATSNPTVGHLIEQFEGDPRTARLAILLAAIDPNVLPVTRLADLVPGLYLMPEPLEPADLVLILDRIRVERGRWFVPADERARLGQAARGWLAAQSPSAAGSGPAVARSNPTREPQEVKTGGS